MIPRAQQEKAQRLLSLHHGGDILVLPNIWNPIGARVLEKKGYPAIATASAAISASLGYQDGEKIKRSTLIDLIGRIARSVEIPVSADIEAGYGETLAEVEDTAQQVIESGVVGVNIEDSLKEGGPLRPVEEQCQRIATLRQMANRLDMPLVINARVDSFISDGFADRQQALEEAVMRAKAYTAVGADCIYPLGPNDEATVRILRQRIESPLNILASPAAASLSTLRMIGINRVSFGPFIFRSCLNKFAVIAEELLKEGDYACFADMLSHDETIEYLHSGTEL